MWDLRYVYQVEGETTNYWLRVIIFDTLRYCGRLYLLGLLGSDFSVGFMTERSQSTMKKEFTT